jgi:DmsE family decaheme c-type cytochrome
MKTRSVVRNLKLGAALVLLSAFAVVINSDATTVTSSSLTKQEPQEAQQPSGYAGSETCQACHEDVYKQYATTAHHVTETSARYQESAKGCEACHGPGQDHADASGDPEKIFNPKGKPPRVANERCLTCHQQQEERHNFRQSEHGLSQVACIDCHSVHPPKPTEHLLVSKGAALCYQCHGEVRQQFQRPFHHRVHEKGMNCTDCHNPHGGFNLAQTRDSAGGTDPICFKCHTEKQGPFVFEHAPVKLEGCVICHTPHGSNNPKLLKRNLVQQLCLECHANTPGIFGPEPPAFHDIRNPRFQNCTSCHVKIHGSNVNPIFLQ